MERLPRKREFSGKDGAAECGGNSPQESRGRDEKISAQGMRSVWAGFLGGQGSVTESDDGAGSSNWSRRAGSNPVTTCRIDDE